MFVFFFIEFSQTLLLDSYHVLSNWLFCGRNCFFAFFCTKKIMNKNNLKKNFFMPRKFNYLKKIHCKEKHNKKKKRKRTLLNFLRSWLFTNNNNWLAQTTHARAAGPQNRKGTKYFDIKAVFSRLVRYRYKAQVPKLFTSRCNSFMYVKSP